MWVRCESEMGLFIGSVGYTLLKHIKGWSRKQFTREDKLE